MPAEALELLLRKGTVLVETLHVHADPDDHAQMQDLLCRAIKQAGYGAHHEPDFQLEVYRQVGQRTKYRTITL